MEKLKHINSYKIYCILLIAIWTKDTLISYITAFLLRIPVISYSAHFLIYFVFVLLIVLSLPYMKERIMLKDLFFYFVFLLFYIVSYFIQIDTSDYLYTNMIKILFINAPVYFVGLCFNAKDSRLYKMLYYSSILSVFLSLVNVFVIGIDKINSILDNMSLAYGVLPHICFVIGNEFQNRKIVNKIAICIGTILLLIFGTRGSIVCELIYVFLYLIRYKKKRGLIYYLILIIIFYFLFNHYTDIVIEIRNLFYQFGLRTRIFDRILNGTFSTSIDRGRMISNVRAAIENKPLLGYGMAGDILLTGSNVYVHNIFYELLCSYGIPIGLSIFISIAIIVFKALFKSKNKKEFDFILSMTIGPAIIKLFVSSSYLLEQMFFLNIGVCNSIRREKYEKNTNYYI